MDSAKVAVRMVGEVGAVGAAGLAVRMAAEVRAKVGAVMVPAAAATAAARATEEVATAAATMEAPRQIPPQLELVTAPQEVAVMGIVAGTMAAEGSVVAVVEAWGVEVSAVAAVAAGTETVTVGKVAGAVVGALVVAETASEGAETEPVEVMRAKVGSGAAVEEEWEGALVHPSRLDTQFHHGLCTWEIPARRQSHHQVRTSDTAWGSRAHPRRNT